ncbi:glycogen/starch synthase, partial [Salmonella enterica]
MQARVLLVSSEAVPLVKTGGLADVITALAVSLRKVGIDASI